MHAMLVIKDVRSERPRVETTCRFGATRHVNRRAFVLRKLCNHCCHFCSCHCNVVYCFVSLIGKIGKIDTVEIVASSLKADQE